MRVDVTFDATGAYSIATHGQTFAPGAGPLPSPPVLFLGSLAACAGVYALNYLKSRDLPFAGLTVIGQAEIVEGPRRVGDMKIQVVLPAPIEDRHMAPLQRSVDLCLIKNSLDQPPSVVVELMLPARVA